MSTTLWHHTLFGSFWRQTNTKFSRASGAIAIEWDMAIAMATRMARIARKGSKEWQLCLWFFPLCLPILSQSPRVSVSLSIGTIACGCWPPFVSSCLLLFQPPRVACCAGPISFRALPSHSRSFSFPVRQGAP